LQGANLTGVDLKNVNIRGAQYDEQTIFPAGYDAKANGLIFLAHQTENITTEGATTQSVPSWKSAVRRIK
jgi:uncharacterized protein YjbI with pentapeptide repeats